MKSNIYEMLYRLELASVAVLLWVAYAAAVCESPQIQCFTASQCESDCPGGGQPHDACDTLDTTQLGTPEIQTWIYALKAAQACETKFSSSTEVRHLKDLILTKQPENCLPMYIMCFAVAKSKLIFHAYQHRDKMSGDRELVEVLPVGPIVRSSSY
jgi:hypothetical protein